MNQTQFSELVQLPRLDTANPFVQASRDEDEVRGGNAYALLAAAAQLNQPRVRELIARARSAQAGLEAGETVFVMQALQALEFGLGALLPPVNVRIKLPQLAGARSLSGRGAQKKAA